MNITIEQAPSGKWFVSNMGWGRRFDTKEAAEAYYSDHPNKGGYGA